MAARALLFSNRLYRRLLQIYPRTFRIRFAEEMAQVFSSLCAGMYAGTGWQGVAKLWLPALLDLGRSAINQWLLSLFQRRMEDMQTNAIDGRDDVSPSTPGEAFLAALPFLLSGVSYLVEKLNIPALHSTTSPFWTALLVLPRLAGVWLILAGLAIGIALGFPRWAISFLAWGILTSWAWGSATFNGQHVGGLIWMGLLGAFLIGPLARRSFQPLRSLVDRLRQEWTVVSLALYILFGWVYMDDDMNHHPLLLGFITVTTLAVSLGAWGYFRAGTPLRRILWLIGGLLAASVLNMVSSATWDYAAYYGVPANTDNGILVGMIFFIVLAVFMLGDAWLARWRRQKQAQKTP